MTRCQSALSVPKGTAFLKESEILKLLTILAKHECDKMTLKKVINKVINISKQGDKLSVDNFWVNYLVVSAIFRIFTGGVYI